MALEAFAPPARSDRQVLYEKLGTWVFVAVVAYAAVGNSPFSSLEIIEAPADGGDIVNKIAWVSFAAISVLIGVQADMSAARRLFLRAWPAWLVLAWVFASVGWADHPDLALRRGVRLAILAATGYGLALTMPNPARFMQLMLIVTGGVMAINVVGTVVLPHIAIGDSGVRGMHSHKNTAGQVALIAVLTWLVAAAVIQDVRARAIVFIGGVIWVGFLILTQSKTSLGVAAVVPMILIAGNLVMRADRLTGWMLALLFSTAGLGLWLFFLAIGWGWTDLGLFVFDDLTFTGRTSLWSFISGEIREDPWLGVGYGSFWQTGLRFSPLQFTREWFSNASQSHNGYLDLILHLGFLGFGLALIAIIISMKQALQLLGRPGIGAAEQGAYLMATAFLLGILLMNFMETSYFRSAGYLGTIFLFIYFAVARWSMEPPGSDNGYR